MGDVCVVLYGGQLMQKLQMLKDLVRNWDDYIMVLSKKRIHLPQVGCHFNGEKTPPDFSGIPQNPGRDL